MRLKTQWICLKSMDRLSMLNKRYIIMLYSQGREEETL